MKFLFLIFFIINPIKNNSPEVSIKKDISVEYSYANIQVTNIFFLEDFILIDYLERIMLNLNFEYRQNNFSLTKIYNENKITKEEYEQGILNLINIHNKKINIINTMISNDRFSSQKTKLYEVVLLDINEENTFNVYYLLNERNEIFGTMSVDMLYGFFGLTPTLFSNRCDNSYFSKNKSFYYIF